jgi:NAD(P)-dependent dehydrogenase (short-subunit alcohol dehydrogenase family)
LIVRFVGCVWLKENMRMLLEGKKGLIIGVANKHSIAWAIAQAAVREGAQLLFNYQNDRLRENVEELARTIPKANAFPCDVGDDTQIDALMKHDLIAFGSEARVLEKGCFKLEGKEYVIKCITQDFI